MRVLIINYEYPPLGGGAANASYYISKGLCALGNEVTVVTSLFRNLPEYEIVDGIKVIRVPTGRKHLSHSGFVQIVTFVFFSLLRMRRILKDNRPEITLAFFTIPSGFLAFCLKLLYKTPYVVSLRGADVPGAKGRYLNFFHKLFLPLTKVIWKQASSVVANSKGMEKLARSTEQLSYLIVPNGVDQKRFNINGSNKRRKEDLTVDLLYVGRMEKNKGVEDLLDVVSYLRVSTNIRFKLLLVGDGPHKTDIIERAKEMKILGCIDLLGWIDKKDIARIYNDADLFLMPSRYEGMSNAVLEALAARLPVIAYAISGNDELIKSGYNGFLIKPYDIKAFIEKTQLLVEDKKLRKLMGNNSSYIAKRYSWNVISRSYLKILKKQFD